MCVAAPRCGHLSSRAAALLADMDEALITGDTCARVGCRTLVSHNSTNDWDDETILIEGQRGASRGLPAKAGSGFGSGYIVTNTSRSHRPFDGSRDGLGERFRVA